MTSWYHHSQDGSGGGSVPAPAFSPAEADGGSRLMLWAETQLSVVEINTPQISPGALVGMNANVLPKAGARIGDRSTHNLPPVPHMGRARSGWRGGEKWRLWKVSERKGHFESGLGVSELFEIIVLHNQPNTRHHKEGKDSAWVLAPRSCGGCSTGSPGRQHPGQHPDFLQSS